jgi:hypothetical protein
MRRVTNQVRLAYVRVALRMVAGTTTVGRPGARVFDTLTDNLEKNL